MSVDQHDPRLTAYALGELSDDEGRALEAEIAGDAAILAEVESVRAMAELLAEGLGRGAPTAMSAEQRAAIETAAGEGRRDESPPDRNVTKLDPPRRRRAAWVVAGGAVAALAASVFLLVNTAQRDQFNASRLDDGARTPTASEVSPPLPYAVATAVPGDLRGAPMKVKQGIAADEAPTQGFNTESYDHFVDNPFVLVAQDPRSTFSIDVDTAGYALVRRHLQEGHLPPAGAVRIEEMLNYFEYAYPEPTGDAPFSVSTEVSAAPWAPTHTLFRIGIKGKHVAAAERPNANLVFLLDVSGSMESPDKLPLLKEGLKLLVAQLDANDRVSIAVYAGASGLVLPPTPGDRKHEILDALSRLEAGGSTNGGEGIALAYAQARSNLVKGGINRVILATDGDFNVGTTSESELVRLIESEAKSGVFLSVLGFGSGNYQDSTLEKLADKGNGNYAYIDSAREAKKVLVEQAAGTLITIAKDVKLQLEMNPTKVEAFRLIGYENRVLAHQDFTDDQKDAGEIGADHTVTALYELIPKGEPVPSGAQGSMLRYQQPTEPTTAARTNELLTVKLRYQLPAGSTSTELELQVANEARPFASASRDHQFAAAVASFGMLLRGSEHKGSSSYELVIDTAQRNAGDDPYRNELVTLARQAQGMAR